MLELTPAWTPAWTAWIRLGFRISDPGFRGFRISDFVTSFKGKRNAMKSTFISIILMTISVTAHAQYIQAGGDFQSSSTELRTILLDAEKGVLAAQTVVASGSCSGTFAGIGQIKGRILLLEPYSKIEGAEMCLVKIEFDQKWKSARITEGEGCSAYHGASCGWEGQVLKKR